MLVSEIWVLLCKVGIGLFRFGKDLLFGVGDVHGRHGISCQFPLILVCLDDNVLSQFDQFINGIFAINAQFPVDRLAMVVHAPKQMKGKEYDGEHHNNIL